MRIAHGLWGTLGLAACLVLVFAGGGHPPPIVFVPVVAAVWAAGHGAVWAAGRLAARGRRTATWARSERPPVGLVLALGLTGLASSIGLLQVVVSLVLSELYPFRMPGLWAGTLLIWIAHGVCFAGLLLRKRWSRPLCAGFSLAWALLLAAQIGDHLMSGAPAHTGDLLLATALLAALAVFGWHLATSKRVRMHLES